MTHQIAILTPKGTLKKDNFSFEITLNNVRRVLNILGVSSATVYCDDICFLVTENRIEETAVDTNELATLWSPAWVDGIWNDDNEPTLQAWAGGVWHPANF